MTSYSVCVSLLFLIKKSKGSLYNHLLLSIEFLYPDILQCVCVFIIFNKKE